MKEYMVHIWGGAWNDDAAPSIEKDLGIKDGYHYFKSESALRKFLSLLDIEMYSSQGLMRRVFYDEMSHNRTVFVGTLEYQGKQYVIHYDFGFEYPIEQAGFMFIDGDYSCDCNRSLFIQREYGEDAIPELPCGDDIKLISYHYDFIKGKESDPDYHVH